MLVRKKDWNDLLRRLSTVEQGHNALNARMWDNKAETEKVRDQLGSLIDHIGAVRQTVFAVLAKLKSVFGDYNIYTKAEIDKMGADEYAQKVLAPLGIQIPLRD